MKLEMALAVVWGVGLGFMIALCEDTQPKDVEPLTPKILPGYPACIQSKDLNVSSAPYDSDSCMNTADLVYYQFSILATTDAHLIRVYLEDDQTADLYIPTQSVHYP